ncbi:MAG: hypothetical protein J6Z11_16215 [Candidatus Riflebacteria bacterium]|nr:hypothetical protein [Candidatus Riflebacteria bacterium]
MEKTVKNANDFKSLAEKYKYTVSDVTKQYSANQKVKNATVAKSSQDFQIEFYVLEDEGSAGKMFYTNKAKFENSKSGASMQASSSNTNYSTYSLTSNNKYMYLCRVDNTLLSLNIPSDYKDNVNKFIEEFEY